MRNIQLKRTVTEAIEFINFHHSVELPAEASD